MYKWTDFKINLDDNQLSQEHIEIDCPSCLPRRTKNHIPTLFINTNDQSWFCKHCGFAGNLLQGFQQISPSMVLSEPWIFNPTLKLERVHQELSKTVIENFKKKRISETTLNHFKIGITKKYFPEIEENLNCLVYPYYQNHRLVNIVYLYGSNKTSEIGGVQSCFNYDNIDLDHTYIVLDELEVFSFYEAGRMNVISLFGGLPHLKDEDEKYKNKVLECLTNIEDKIKDIKKITLALPNKPIGNLIKDELLRRFGKERCWVVQPPEQNYSWNDILVDYGPQKLGVLLDTAKAIPVRGIFDIDDVEDRFDELYYNGLTKGYTTGYESLDEHYTVVPGQWTILTGIPGHGKSNFLDSLMVNLSVMHDWRFAIFSPENQPIARHFAGIIEKYYKRPFDLDRAGRITEEQKDEGKEWLKKHFSVILPDEDDSWSIDGVLSLAKVLVYRKGIKGLVIDPWNELDHSRPNNQTETEYVSSVLTKIRQFARNYGVHVWLVAHPAKLYKDKDGKYPVPTPYDISGSAHYRNKADNAITVWRNVGHEDQNVADIHVQKIRFKEVGKVGLVSLRSDIVTSCFYDDIDQNKRRKALESGEVVPTERLRKTF